MYGLMSISIVTLVTVLVFVMLGYQFNRSDGKIEQGGLVQFESRPVGADVFIDGNNLGSRTASKTTLNAGKHFIKMQRDGYKTWQKSVTVVPGAVLWLNYARLIPNEIKTSSVADFATVSSAASSQDNKWMVIKEDPATPAVRLADLSGDTVKLTNLTLPESSFTQPGEGQSQTFTLEKWDPDSRYALVKHVYNGDKTEWLVLDTRDASQTKNITTSLGINPVKVEFDPNNSALLYVLVDNDIRRVDLGAVTLSGPLVTNAADFSLYESYVAYVTLPDPATKVRTAGYYTEGAKKTRTVKSYSDDGTLPLHFQLGKYFDETYAAVSYGENIEILRGELSDSDDKTPSLMKPMATVTLPGGVQYLSTKTNGRFIVAQSGPTYTVYDMELDKLTTTTTKGTSPITGELDWLDSYMLWSDRDGTLRFYEFDGANQHDIMTVAPGFSASLSPNSKFVYGISKSDDGKFHLKRAQLLQ